MDLMVYNKTLYTPTYVKTPDEPSANRSRGSAGSDNTSKELLEQKIEEESQVSFSKHAIEHVVERGVDVFSEKTEHLNERARMVEEKGLRESLIPLGSIALIVDVKNDKVVTVVNEDSLKGMVSTNINGTVMTQPALLETILIPSDGQVERLEKEN